MVDEIQRQRAFTRPATGRTLADTFNRPSGGSIGPAGGPTTFRNTYPLSAQRVDDYMTRGMGPRGFNRQQSGPPANIGFDRMGIGSLTPSNIGRDRHPTTMDPIMNMLDNPQVLLDYEYERDLKRQMDPDNFIMNRINIGNKWGVDPFGDIQTAAVPRDDWRTWEKILGAGGNPDDYEVTGIKPRTGDFDITGGPYYPENEGIMQVAELGLPQPMDWQNERLSLDELIDLGASQEQIAQYLGVV
jgi:hypothetical protein